MMPNTFNYEWGLCTFDNIIFMPWTDFSQKTAEIEKYIYCFWWPKSLPDRNPSVFGIGIGEITEFNNAPVRDYWIQ